jgi:hypothetical protein
MKSWNTDQIPSAFSTPFEICITGVYHSIRKEIIALDRHEMCKIADYNHYLLTAHAHQTK